MKFKELEIKFNNAKLLSYKYVGVLSKLPYGTKPELRVHVSDDFDIAIKEYKKRYGNDLKHAFANVKIIDAMFANELNDFEVMFDKFNDNPQ
ncbi:MAG: hypothetical protein K6G26_12920 [Lachnospiraceae bacterium]|nr:hypothetical protein [Lachnospiraceae bacterium]